jgi:hypothetical protein
MAKKKTPEELKQEEEGNAYIRQREQLASQQGISSRRAAELMIPQEETKLREETQQRAEEAARNQVNGMDIQNERKLAEDNLRQQELNRQPKGVIGNSLNQSPLGLVQQATGIPLEDTTTGDAARLARTGAAVGIAFGAAALLGGIGGSASVTAGTAVHAAKTIPSIIKTSRTVKALTGIALLSFVKEPIQQLIGYLSGTTDIDVALSDSAVDLNDITTDIDMGLSADDALSSLNDIEANLNSLDIALHNANGLSKTFYIKKGLSQQKDERTLRERLKLMRFNIIKNQMLGKKPNQ